MPEQEQIGAAAPARPGQVLEQIGAVGESPILAPLEPHPRYIVVEDVYVSVNADGANGQTTASALRARVLGVQSPDGGPVRLAAYHPADWGKRTDWRPYGRRAYGLDAPENGGNSLSNAYGWLVIDGKPVIQRRGDPAPGYLVSTTALRNHTKPETDPTAYHDSAGSPGITLPGHALDRFGISLGDLVLVQNGPYKVWAQVCDAGNAGHFEASVYLCDQLGINDCARDGGGGGLRLTFIPRSRVHIVDPNGRPRPGTADEIADVGPKAALAAGVVWN